FVLVRINTRREWFFYNILFFLKHPLKFIKGLSYIINASVAWKDFYYKFMNCFVIHNAKYQKAKRFSNAVIDQGYFQNLLSVFGEPKTADFFIGYLKNFIYPEFLVVLELSFDKRKERLARRGYGVREDFPKSQVEIWREASEKNYLSAKSVLNKSGVNFEIFNSEKSPKELVEAIINKLKNGSY
ncbi:MAG: hypothetical protein WCX70_02710, partial [Candidatus Paceibacterota bacterium]